MMAWVRLSIEPVFLEELGGGSVGTISVIMLVREHARLGLKDAKTWIDRAVFGGEIVEIPMPTLEAAENLVQALALLPATPQICASVIR